MSSEKSKDVTLGLFILAFAIGGFVFINPTDAEVTEGPGGLSWRTIPYIYSGLLLALALAFIGITLFKGPIPVDSHARVEPAGAEGEDGPGGSEGDRTRRARLSTIRRIGVVAALVAYSQALDAFGFALSTPVFLFVVLWLFGRRDLVQNAAVAVVGGFALWLLFDYLLKMPLRGSVWDPLSPALTAVLRALGA